MLNLMGRNLGDNIPEKTSISFTPMNIKDMNRSMKDKEFKTLTDLVNHAIRFYYDHHHDTALTKEWLLSAEGERFIKGIMQKKLDDSKKP